MIRKIKEDKTIKESSAWSDTERAIRKTKISAEELYDILTTAGHNVYPMKDDRQLLANYLAGVLEGSIGGR